ncbi:MAG TPA: glycosyltransferase [Patescibacteria group bacterium]|nr:glycosyltransferase [Patescibacteria group bacterium]
MILITVGTTPFPFRRMVDLVEQLILIRKHNEAIIFQHGDTACTLSGKNVFLYQTLPFQRMQRYIQKARVVVCQGGPATIYQAIAAGKIPFVLPREKKFGEHVNDHQVFYCDILKKRGLVFPVISCAAMLCRRQKPRRSSSGRGSLPRLITYLHGLTKVNLL